MNLESKEKPKNKIKIKVIAIVVIALVLITLGVSYALWFITKEQKEKNILSTSCLNVTMNNQTDDISLSNTFPITDEEGLNKKPFSFTIQNNCEAYADYTINLESLSETTLNSKYVKISLSEKGDKGVATKLEAYETYDDYKISGSIEGRQIKRGKLKPSESKEYELRIWIDEDVTKEDGVEGSIYKSKVIVESILGEKPYTESILHGTDPVLDGGLIPITINEENGKVTRADESKKWYSYAEQKWANAVILRDGIEDPGANEPIEESDIESYFVWIPRYKYEIFDEGNYEDLSTKEDKTKIINIEFESKDEPVQTGSKVGQMLTHPAFTSFNTNGLWVGKFETGYDGAGSTGAAGVNPANEAAAIEASKKVIIKPNVYSWRNIQVSKAYTVGRHYEASLNSHMMKNTEWGAIAYLSQSEYGSHTSVRINNNSNYITGYAAVHEPTTGYTGTNELCSNNQEACNEYGGVTSPGEDGTYNTNYFNKASVVASTTNNFTGVYDMSGGAWEYTMAGMDDNSTGDGKTGNLSVGRHNVWNSGFNGKLTCPECNDNGIEINHEVTEVTGGIDLPRDERFFDKYDYSKSITTYNRGLLGDATKEMGPFHSMRYGTQTRYTSSWYDNESSFIYTVCPWFIRGGGINYGSGAGVFNFLFTAGDADSRYSFRLVLAF